MKTTILKEQKFKSNFFKKVVLFLSVAIVTISCNKDDNVATTSGEGTANIVLTAGGQQFTINGPCGFANAGGVKYIGANQSDNNLRAFSANFNITDLPTSTTTYTLVDDSLDENPTHITMSLTEISTSNPPKLTGWNSTEFSGNLTLVVTGNKYTVDLAGITLAPNEPTSGFENGNVGAFANNGTLTGTLTFYKQ